jgi:(p)ppGpp synthase/HD superfamily hydrolase
MSNMNIVGEAFEIASDAHRGVYRKGYNLPYMVHPMRVSSSLAIHIKDDVVLAAALLHDVLEDCAPDKLVEFQQRIQQLDSGITIIHIVEELTKPEGVDKNEYMKSFATKSVEALVIKLFDRLDNVMDFRFHNPNYSEVYSAKALVLYETVKARLEDINSRFGYKFAKVCDEVVSKLIACAKKAG